MPVRGLIVGLLLLLAVPQDTMAEVVACTQCVAAEYDVIELPGSGRFPAGTSINARGDVAVFSGGGLGPPFGSALVRDGVQIPVGVYPAVTVATAVNGAGVVVGQSRNRAFMWDRRVGVVVPLVGGGMGSYAYGINVSGQIVGVIYKESGRRAFRWEDHVTTKLPWLPGGSDSEALGINELGFAVGWSATAGSDVPHATMWKPSGGVRDLGTLGGATSRAYSISARGQVVGQSDTASGEHHAFLWQKGGMVDLGTLGGASSVAYSVNGCGQVVGVSETASGKFHAFVWQNGTMTDIGAPYNDGQSTALSINDAGQIVGQVQAQPSVFRAVMWAPK